jgi:hypothetical protein
MDQESWRRHWGPHYDRWLANKRALDPHDVFCSLLLPGE